MEEVKLYAADPAHGCRFGALGNVFISVFASTGQIEQLNLGERVQAQLVKEHGKLIALSIVRAVRLEAPSKEFREATTRLQQKFDEDLICSAIVIEGSGLTSVMVRTFMAMHELTVKRKVPQQVFRDVKAAVAWIQQTVPEASRLMAQIPAIERFAQST